MKKVQINISFVMVLLGTWGMYAIVLGFATNFLGGVCGLQSYQISLVLGISAAAACALQVAVGEIVSRIEKLQMHTVLLAAGILMLCGLGLMYAQLMPLLTIGGMVLACTVLQTIPGIVTSMAIDGMARGLPLLYNMTRGFGSISYGLSAVLTGRLLASLGPEVIPVLSGLMALLLTAATIWFYLSGTRHLPNFTREKKQKLDTGFLKTHPLFVLLLAGGTLICVSHFLVGSFVQLIIEAKGGGQNEQGIATAITSVCSLPITFSFTFLMKKIPVRRMAQLGALLVMAKPIGLLLSASPSGVYIAMATQMLGYGLYEISMVNYLAQIMEPEEAVRVQSYLSATMSAGSVAAMFAGGTLCQFLGVQAMVGISAAFALSGACIVLLWMRKIRK